MIFVNHISWNIRKAYDFNLTDSINEDKKGEKTFTKRIFFLNTIYKKKTILIWIAKVFLIANALKLVLLKEKG